MRFRQMRVRARSPFGVALLLAALVSASSATGEQTASAIPGYLKLDAKLRDLVSRGATTLSRVDTATPLVSVYIESNDPDAAANEVRSAGGTTGTRSGRILTAHVPASSVPTLASLGHVARMEAGRRIHKRLDKALPAMSVDALHAGASPLGAAVRGSGSVVGIIDDGFDVTHSAFKDAQGKTRIVSLWDQTATVGTPPHGLSYGNECSRASIDAGTCSEVADVHGTHVAGIAAGSAVSGTPYVGVAPEADLVFVKIGVGPTGGSGSGSTSTDVCDAVDYVFRTAEALGKPAVINMSFGSQSDPHDGSSLASRCLDGKTGPGKLIVAAAGNEGEGGRQIKSPPTSGTPLNIGDPVYLHAGFAPSSTPTVLPIALSALQFPQDGNLWFDSGSVTLKIGLLSKISPPTWSVKSSAFTLSSPASSWSPTIPGGTKKLGPVIVMADTIASGPSGFEFVIEDDNGDMAEVGLTWALEVTGDAPRVDAFFDTTYYSGFLGGGAVTPDNAMGISYPAVSANVIAAASYVTRTSWMSGGKEYDSSNPITGASPILGALSAFSSRGPARGSHPAIIKPEIAAPGESIISALSAGGATDVTHHVIVGPPNGFVIEEGTSMSSPAVTGVVALLLSQQPNLGVAEMRELIMDTADPVAGAVLPNTEWGAGKINALAALSELCRRGGGDGGAPACRSGSTASDGGGPDSSRSDGGIASPEEGGSEAGSRDDASVPGDASANPQPGDSAAPPDTNHAGGAGSETASDAGAEPVNPNHGGGGLSPSHQGGAGNGNAGLDRAGSLVKDADPDGSAGSSPDVHHIQGCECHLAPQRRGLGSTVSLLALGLAASVARRRRRISA